MSSVNQYYIFRLSRDKKEQFKELCDKQGITLSEAVHALADAAIEKQDIPFSLGAGGIEALESAAYSRGAGQKKSPQITVRMNREIIDKFREACDGAGFSMSELTRLYIECCIRAGEILLFQA